MMLIACPFCGPRDETEFSCGGEAHITRPHTEKKISDSEFADYLFMRDNPKGLFLERWRHTAGCRRWFNMARDTVSHEIVEIYPMGTLPKTAAAKAAFAESWRRSTKAEQAEKLTQTSQKQVAETKGAK